MDADEGKYAPFGRTDVRSQEISVYRGQERLMMYLIRKYEQKQPAERYWNSRQNWEQLSRKSGFP